MSTEPLPPASVRERYICTSLTSLCHRATSLKEVRGEGTVYRHPEGACIQWDNGYVVLIRLQYEPTSKGAQEIAPLPRRKNFEYHSLLVATCATIADLDRLGREGWELVSVHRDDGATGHPGSQRYTFKRELLP